MGRVMSERGPSPRESRVEGSAAPAVLRGAGRGLEPVRVHVRAVLEESSPVWLTVVELLDEIQDRGLGVYSRQGVRPAIWALVEGGLVEERVREHAAWAPREYRWRKKGSAISHRPSGKTPSVTRSRDTSPAGAGEEQDALPAVGVDAGGGAGGCGEDGRGACSPVVGGGAGKDTR